jgi:hypothetical protein
MMLVLGIETGLGQSKRNPKLEPKTGTQNDERNDIRRTKVILILQRDLFAHINLKRQT